MIQQLEALKNLFDSGAITESEFNDLKNKIINDNNNDSNTKIISESGKKISQIYQNKTKLNVTNSFILELKIIGLFIGLGIVVIAVFYYQRQSKSYIEELAKNQQPALLPEDGEPIPDSVISAHEQPIAKDYIYDSLTNTIYVIDKNIDINSKRGYTEENVKKEIIFITDGQKCTNCNVGLYHNGACDICDYASSELKNTYNNKWKNEIEQNGNLKEQLKCPVCFGAGCEHCSYKGYRLPSDMMH
jgi:hypothetical protein